MGSRRISMNALRVVVLCQYLYFCSTCGSFCVSRNVFNEREILSEKQRVFRRDERDASDASLSFSASRERERDAEEREAEEKRERQKRREIGRREEREEGEKREAEEK
jgi:hypothetical protein